MEWNGLTVVATSSLLALLFFLGLEPCAMCRPVVNCSSYAAGEKGPRAKADQSVWNPLISGPILSRTCRLVGTATLARAYLQYEEKGLQ